MSITIKHYVVMHDKQQILTAFIKEVISQEITKQDQSL